MWSRARACAPWATGWSRPRAPASRPTPTSPPTASFQGHLPRAADRRRGGNSTARWGIQRHDRERRNAAYLRNLQFFDAPHAVFIFLFGEFEEREAVDLGIYAQTMMLAMTARGIASCAQGALSLYPGIVRDHLGLGCDHRLIFGISFGYEDAAAAANRARVGRATVDAAIRFHR